MKQTELVEWTLSRGLRPGKGVSEHTRQALIGRDDADTLASLKKALDQFLAMNFRMGWRG